MTKSKKYKVLLQLYHQAILCQVELSVGQLPDPTWKCQLGRPRAKWTDQLCQITIMHPPRLWR